VCTYTTVGSAPPSRRGTKEGSYAHPGGTDERNRPVVNPSAGRTRTPIRIAATCLTTAILAACSSGSHPGPASPTNSAATVTTAGHGLEATPDATDSPSPSASPTDVRAIAVDVYRAMWQDMVEAGKTADYSSPRLADHATSQALQLLYQGLLAAHQQNLVIKGEPHFAPTVTGVTPASSPVAVSITDCMDDTRWLNYTRDGRLQNNNPGGKHHTTATVGLLNGRWMVTRLQVAGIGTCS
jgi:hypothetical protein